MVTIINYGIKFIAGMEKTYWLNAKLVYFWSVCLKSNV